MTTRFWPAIWVVTLSTTIRERLVLAADLLRRRGGHKLRILMLGDGKDYEKCHGLSVAGSLMRAFC